MMAIATASHAQNWTSARPDGHAPIGVLGDHTHGAGEFMISYRYMYMGMSGSLDGTTPLSNSAIVDPAGPYGFLVTPTDMPMQMHMLGLMYAPTDALTLMAMVPAVGSSMDHVTRMSVMADPNATAFTTNSSGLGDVSVGALYRFATPDRQRVHASVGVNFPTGSTTEMGITPMSPDEVQLPYPMQTGSGTVDLKPGLTYLGQSNSWSWGSQANATVRLGNNDQDYHLGSVYAGTVWGARKLGDAISASVRTEIRNWRDISGASPVYDMAVMGRVVPTVFPDLRGGTHRAAAAGVNVVIPEGVLEGLRFAAEASMPVYQSLDGPDLEAGFSVMFGFQYAPPH